jgi:hypothetical protein
MTMNFDALTTIRMRVRSSNGGIFIVTGSFPHTTTRRSEFPNMTRRNKAPSLCYPATRQGERALVELLEQGERSGVSTHTILDILAAVKVDGKPSVYYPLPSGDPRRRN